MNAAASGMKLLLAGSCVMLFLLASDVRTLSALTCPGAVVGDPNGTPSITITPQPSQISGIAQNVDGQTERVVCYAFTDCAYIQPDASAWGTNICSDGSWSTFTNPWGRLGCLVVDQTVFPHPSKVCTSRDTELCELPGVKACGRYPTPRIVPFTQSSWEVKDSSGYPVDPGRHAFSASQNNVSVDGAGALHLRAVQSASRWTSSEIFNTASTGYGAYQCRIGSRLDHLDSNAVAACFIYESPTQEIDFIECSPSLISPPNQCHYVVQPYTVPGNIHQFPMPPCPTSTHRVLWLPNRIEFMSWCGLDPYPPQPSQVIAQWTYMRANTPPSEGKERAHANLWLNNADPSGSGDLELVLDSFDLPPTPAAAPGGRLVLSAHLLDFGTVRTGQTRKMTFTIENGGYTTLNGNVDGDALSAPLRVTGGAGTFSLTRNNKVWRVTVAAEPSAAGPFSGTITITSGDPRHRKSTVRAKGRARK